VDWRSFAVGFLLFELSLNFEGLAFSLWVSQTLPASPCPPMFTSTAYPVTHLAGLACLSLPTPGPQPPSPASHGPVGNATGSNSNRPTVRYC
jgi:hypothetical protein